LQSYGGLKSQDVEKIQFFLLFGKMSQAYAKIPQEFIATPIDVLCSNFVIIG